MEQREKWSGGWKEGTILTDYEWEIIRLREKEDLKWAEIAKKLNTSESSAIHAYASAQKKLAAAERTLRELGRRRGISSSELDREIEELRKRLGL